MAPQAPGRAGRPRSGSSPDMERYRFDLDRPAQRGRPLAGRLPSGAEEVQMAALLESHMHFTFIHVAGKGSVSESHWFVRIQMKVF